MPECLECLRLREDCALAFAEYLSCKDELGLTDKKAKEFTARRRGFERAEGRLRECRAKEAHHRGSIQEAVYRPTKEFEIRQPGVK